MAFVQSPDGTRIYYEKLGEDPQLLFVHGIGGDLDAWQFVCEPLRQANIGYLALDLRGHGYSDHPRTAAAYTIEKLQQDILALLDQEHNKKITLVGHSGGAIIALLFALAYPERLESLILINGTYTAPNYLRSRVLEKAALGATAILARLSLPPTKPWHSSYPLGKYHKDFEWYGLARTIYHNSLYAYLYSAGLFLMLDIQKKLPQLSMPTLLIAGGKDSIYPLHIQKTMHRLIPHSTLVIINEGNHPLPVNYPHEVADHIFTFLP